MGICAFILPELLTPHSQPPVVAAAVAETDAAVLLYFRLSWAKGARPPKLRTCGKFSPNPGGDQSEFYFNEPLR